MLKLKLSPKEDASRVGPTEAKWSEPTLTVDGTAYDLSELPDGATASHPVLGKVSRGGDDYECTIPLRYLYGAPEETCWPEPVTVTEDGPIELPPYDAPQPEPEEEPTDEQ